VKLLLVGGGPQEQALRAQVERLGLGQRVIFTGRVPHQEVNRYYSLIDLLLYPRHSMRLTDLVTPLKPLEAMAQQKLLLASDVGGHRELIEDGRTGWLFPAGDAAALARRAEQILAQPDEWPKIRAAGRAFVEQERNWPASVARYRDLYARLLTAA
jgi:glycosyltransferase involved in cell wall biosynthesis